MPGAIPRFGANRSTIRAAHRRRVNSTNSPAAVAWLRAHTELTPCGTVPEALDRCASAAGLLALRRDLPSPGRASSPNTTWIAQPRPAVDPSHRPAGQLLRRGNAQRATVAGCGPRLLAPVAGPRSRANCGPTRSPPAGNLPTNFLGCRTCRLCAAAAPPPADGLIAICTGQAVFFQALARACRIAGYTSVWTTTRTWWSLDGRGRRAVALPGHPTTANSSNCARSQPAAPRVPVVALFGFPRHDHVATWPANVASAAVLSVPFLLPDLWNTLRSILTP